MRKFVILIVILVSAACANAQEVFTLEKCKEMALKNNAKAQNALLSVEAAEQTKKEAFTKYFPNISATGVGLIFNKPLMTQTVETGYPAPNDKVMVEMFKSGVIGGVMATQPIFAGGQILHGNKLAKAGVEVSRLQKQMTDNEVLLETERYFWQLVSLKEKMKTIAEAETMLSRVQSDVKVAVDAGLTTQNDLARITLEQNRLIANRLKLENGILVLKMAFGQHIGLADNFDVEQPDFSNITMPTVETLHATSLQNRPEYRLLEKSVDVAKLQVKMETGKNLPTVAIGAGYNYVNFDNGKPTEMEKKMGLAFATVSVPISGWWGGSHAIKKKKLELLAAENTRRENAELLLIQMRQLAAELGEAYQQVLLAQKSIAVAEENFRMSEEHHKAGISILSDLFDAQSLLQQSRDQYVEAATLYSVKLAEYRQSMGNDL
ncbi:MAG: TolC family protein [Candidatus Symbiothrix sp.]|jgi:outer membrane protein TolC|nr:TolC family protein [Candidatus Symbiothrix sp.]